MSNEKSRNTAITFEFLILELYGSVSYNRIKHSHSFKTAKENYLKLIKTFRFAINETIEVSDKLQINQLNLILNNGERHLKECKKFSELDQEFLCTQTRLILQLIGTVPNREQEKQVINQKHNWKLNSLRQIQYIQNKRQKEISVFSVIQEYPNPFGNWNNFCIFYNDKCNNDIDILMKYLMKNHPEIAEKFV